ncbi:MAG: 3-oxoacyl-ACP synthase III [Thermoguttaceae bacterium]
MKYNNVCVEAFAYTLPDEIVTTAELEQMLSPVYQRLKLPEGRLELMTGIRERRIWKSGLLPGEQSVKTGQLLLEQTNFNPQKIGALIHASVCRDYLEPATACRVHRQLQLPDECAVFDISNACLGIGTGMMQIAGMIEREEIEAGIVLGTESSRSLMETTIRMLNSDMTMDRNRIKKAFASLTIGSGSAAVLLTHRSISRLQNRLIGGITHANTQFCELCQSATDQAGGDTMNPIMWTDSENLMIQGVQTAKSAFDRFLKEINTSSDSIDRFFCHQVGKMHQQLLFETLGLPIERNFSTIEYLGNTGSTAFPIAAALGIEGGFAKSGDRIALMGIGSGINVLMLAVDLA